MEYITLNINNEDYKLRLTTRYIIELERETGRNPIQVFIDMQNNKLPKISDITCIFKYCLKCYYRMTDTEVYDLYDKYLADGHGAFDLIPVFIEVFKEAGLLGKEEDSDSKN